MLCNCRGPLENCPGGCSVTHHRERRSMPLGLHWRNPTSWNSGGALTWTSCPRTPNGSKSPKLEPWYRGAPVMGHTRGMGALLSVIHALAPEAPLQMSGVLLWERCRECSLATSIFKVPADSIVQSGLGTSGIRWRHLGWPLLGSSFLSQELSICKMRNQWL